MSLRIPDRATLDLMSPRMRRQVEQALTDTGTERDLSAQATSGRRARPEQDEGRRLVDWIDSLESTPDLNCFRPGLYFAHVPNGGARTAAEGAILKGQGVRAGWPDYLLDYPVGRYHGWRGELKAPDAGKPDADQLEILARLERVGYCICIAWSFEEMRQSLLEYLAPVCRTWISDRPAVARHRSCEGCPYPDTCSYYGRCVFRRK